MIFNIQFTRKELWIVAVLVVMIAFLASASFLVGFATNKPGYLYTGVSAYYYDDIYTYITWLKQSMDGHLLLQQLYSPEIQTSVYFHPIFSVFGYILGFFTESSILVYQIVRMIGILFFLSSGYLFIAFFFQEKKERMFIFLVLFLGGGLGWVFGFPSADLTQFEFNNFLLMQNVLLPLFAIPLMLFIILHFVALEQGFIKRLISVSLLTNLLLLIHAYDWLPLMGVVFIYSAWCLIVSHDRKKMRLFLWTVVSSFPGILYYIFVIKANTPFAIWTFFQTGVAHTNLWHYVIALLTGLLFASLAYVDVFQNSKSKKYILFFWLLISLLFLFNPVSDRFQRKLALGITFPLFLLAGSAIYRYTAAVKLRNIVIPKSAILLLALLMMTQSNFHLLLRDIRNTYSLTYSPIYITQNELNAFEWFSKNSTKESVILSTPEAGLMLPAFTGKKVYTALTDQNTYFKQKYNLVYALLSSFDIKSDAFRGFLEANKINYIYIDNDSGKSVDFDGSKQYLKLVYGNDSSQIYKVELPND